MIEYRRLCSIRILVIKSSFGVLFTKKKKKMRTAWLDEWWTSAQQTRQATRSTAFPLRAIHRRFLLKRLAFFPEKMRLELAEALHIDRERWNFSESEGCYAQETFQGHLDSERAKLTAISTAAIATLPRASFPKNNFASCLLWYGDLVRRIFIIFSKSLTNQFVFFSCIPGDFSFQFVTPV